MDKCPFCGIHNNDVNHKHEWVFANITCFRKQIINLSTQLTHQTALLREALNIVEHYTDVYYQRSDSSLKVTANKAQALAPKIKAALGEEPNEFAQLFVRKSSIPPGAALVVCYDPGDGIPVIDDVEYPDFRVVKKEGCTCQSEMVCDPFCPEHGSNEL